jgi:thiamine-phosphate pyrophosphorylase
MTARKVSGLYAVTPDASELNSLLQRVKSCLSGGARVIQYRNKNLNAPHREIAAALAAACRQQAAVFIVNDDIELALAVDADGVHLGRDDHSLALARKQLGPDRIIGVSCYADLQHALDAAQNGADYVAFGSMFASSTKPLAPPAPLSLLTEAKTQLHIPVVAIGGITLQNAPQAIAAGADAVAVISAVFDAADVRQAAQSFSNLFTINRP